jgi:multidrug efflux pump subunit AcrB
MSPERLGRLLYDQRRAILAVALASAALGVLSWLLMPKQEDPSLTARFGSVTVLFPGAEAETIEELVAVPTEDALRSVEEISTVEASVRRDVAVFVIELDGAVTDPDPVWTRVERALSDAAAEYPAGASEPDTDWRVMSLQSVIVAIGGSGDPLVLWDAAEQLQERLRVVPGVRAVEITPEPEREVRVLLDDATAASLGIDRVQLTGLLATRLQSAPGGALRSGAVGTTVDPGTRIGSVDELGSTVIATGRGGLLPLASLARLERGAAEPVTGRAWLDNRSVVTVGVEPQASVDVVRFGEQVHEVVQSFRAEQGELTVDYVSFQPDRVSFRLRDLLGSLLQGVAIVAAMVILAMGVRLGMTVAVMVPVVALGGLTIYATLGGVLHQISIAALVMSLGLLVDNAIVVAERIQWRPGSGSVPPRGCRRGGSRAAGATGRGNRHHPGILHSASACAGRDGRVHQRYSAGGDAHTDTQLLLRGDCDADGRHAASATDGQRRGIGRPDAGFPASATAWFSGGAAAAPGADRGACGGRAWGCTHAAHPAAVLPRERPEPAGG